MARIGDRIPALLAERGIDTVFGIPGVHTVELYRGLPGSGLRHITPRHEQGAGFMAEGYWRATGRIPAVFSITGPGLTNLATPMGQALAGSAPMLVISSVNDRAHLGARQGRLHEMPDQSGFARQVALWSETAESLQQIADLLDRALADFATARPGPVHIQIPKDALSETAGEVTAPAPVPAPAIPDVTGALAALNSAESVVLVLGGGAVGLGRDLATRLAEALCAPTLLTSTARGLLPPDHPLNIGGMIHGAEARALLNSADAVLAIGTEFGETDWDFYYDGDLRIDGALVRVDICADRLTRNLRPSVAVCADASTCVAALLPGLRARGPAAATHLPVPQDRYTRHAPLIEAIWRAAPEAIVVGDSTEPAYCAGICARPPHPRSWWSGAQGFGTLGYALPAAIGAKLAAPDRPVVALMGDGGALFTISELASAVEAGVALTLIVWNNSGYGEIRTFMEDAQVRPEGVALSPIDFEALARGFGAAYQRASAIDEVAAALRSAPDNRPSILEIREEDWVWPAA